MIRVILDLISHHIALVDPTPHTSSWVLDTSTSTAVSTMAGDAFLRPLDGLDDVPLELLVRPLVKLDVEASARAARAVVMRFSLKLETGEASARVEMLRRSPPLPWVAPRACAKSARLMARCGGV